MSYFCPVNDVKGITMTRSQEVLLAVFSGILLAFGIHEEGSIRSTTRNGIGLKQDQQNLAEHWKRVGGYIRTAQGKERERQVTKG